MKFLKNLDTAVERTLTFVGGLCLSGIVVVILANVVLRFVFNAPITWSIEACSILVVWMTFIVFGVNHKKSLHFRIDAIVLLFPRKAQVAITTLADFLTLICLGFLGYSAVSAMIVNGSMPMMMIEVPVMYTFYLPFAVGIATYVAYSVASLVKSANANKSEGVSR